MCHPMRKLESSYERRSRDTVFGTSICDKNLSRLEKDLLVAMNEERYGKVRPEVPNLPTSQGRTPLTSWNAATI